MKKEKAPEISVIEPAYNEGLAIGNVISNLIKSLDHIDLPYEIIVVDDGSVDLTGEVAKEAGARVIALPYNHGKGYALRRGFGEATGNIIITMDADGQNDPNEIWKLIALLKEGADVVAGSRYLTKSQLRSLGFWDRLGNLLFSSGVGFGTDKLLSDPLTSFRAYKADVIRKLKLYSEGNDIDIEITVKVLKTSGLRYAEVPVKLLPKRYYAQESRIIADSFRIIRRLLVASTQARVRALGDSAHG